jgi:hypothetical protein
MDRNVLLVKPRHLGVPSGASNWAYGTFGANRAPILHRHKHHLQMDWNEIPYDLRHIGVPSGASNMISKPTVRSVQIKHLSCVKISTISKRIETRFHMTHVT